MTKIFDISNKIRAYYVRDLDPNFGNFHQIRSILNNAQNFDDQTAQKFVQNVPHNIKIMQIFFFNHLKIWKMAHQDPLIILSVLKGGVLHILLLCEH